MTKIKYVPLFFCLLLFAKPVFALDIVVKGLFKDTAILIVDGRQQMLKKGKRSDNGLLLISADAKSAVVDIDGLRQTLTMAKFGPISTKTRVAEKAVVRISASNGGHYYAQGRINGRPVDFLVDTGATIIAMNRPMAEKLGIRYKEGEAITVSTANGIAMAYRVRLKSVRIGELEIKNVDASVSTGDFPSKILLGNSFLSRVNMSTESGLLVLEARY